MRRVPPQRANTERAESLAAKRCGEDKPERKMSLSFVDELQAQVEKLENEILKAEAWRICFEWPKGSPGPVARVRITANPANSD